MFNGKDKKNRAAVLFAILVAALTLTACRSDKSAQEMLSTVKQYVDAYYGGEYDKALSLTSGETYTELSRKLEFLKNIKWKVYNVETKVLYTNRDGTRGAVKCTVTWGDETTQNKYVGQHKYVFDLIKLQDGWKIYSMPTLTGPTDFDF